MAAFHVKDFVYIVAFVAFVLKRSGPEQKVIRMIIPNVISIDCLCHNFGIRNI